MMAKQSFRRMEDYSLKWRECLWWWMNFSYLTCNKNHTLPSKPSQKATYPIKTSRLPLTNPIFHSVSFPFCSIFPSVWSSIKVNYSHVNFSHCFVNFLSLTLLFCFCVHSFYFLTIRGLGKKCETNKLLPTERIWESSKGERRCQLIWSINLPGSSLLESYLHWVMCIPPRRILSQNDWLQTTWKWIPSP